VNGKGISFVNSLIAYVMSDDMPTGKDAELYEHRKTYWVLRTVLQRLHPRDLRTKQHRGPSVCSQCLTIHDTDILGGKLWYKCPLCSSEHNKSRAEKQSDVYALLSPYMPAWRIELLLCLYYADLPQAKQLTGQLTGDDNNDN